MTAQAAAARLDIKVVGWTHTIVFEQSGDFILWTCRVYTRHHKEFTDWMNEHCPTSVCIYRYNSGDPAYIVDITDQEEALTFRLTWVS